MRINRKFKGSKTKDNKGYLKSNEDNFTPFKDIDGGDITMEGVDRQLLAIPLDKNGQPIGMKFMKGGKQYEFGGAANTIEIPTYKKGGKSDWISKKVSTLVKEGRPQNEAIAVAYSMYDEMMDGGVMNYMQNGSMVLPTEDPSLADDMSEWLINSTKGEGISKENVVAAYNRANGIYPTSTPKTPDQFPQLGQGNTASEAEKMEDWERQTFGEGMSYRPTQTKVPDLDYDNIPDAIASVEGTYKNVNSSDPLTVDPTKQPQQQVGTEAALKKKGFADLTPEEQAAQLDIVDQENMDADFEGTEKFISEVDKRSAKAAKEREQEGDYQFFNPYAGVDIPTAANLFGQGIGKGGDPKMAVAAGAKLALGLGRNIISGMGRANSNQFALDEDKKRRREALIEKDPMQAFQQGGTLNDKDRSTIREEAGFDFNDEYINDVFEKVQPAKKPNTYNPSLGRYKDVNYFDNAVVKDNVIKLQTTKRFPGNIDTMDQYVDHIKKANPGYEVDINYNRKDSFGGDPRFKNLEDNTRVADTKFEEAPEFEDGGRAFEEQMLTGNYSGEEQGEVNVEVEENEYIQTPTGSLTKVMGEKHENGGAKMKLEEGTKIVSDHLKIKGAQAKALRKEFDVEVSAKDTYAKAIDKFYKKSGLQEIIDEKEQVIKTIKEQKEKLAQDKGRGEATTNINLEFLSGKLNDLGKAEEPLLAAANMFFDKIYNLQEKSKPAGEGDVEEYKIGGMVYNGDQIVALGKKHNLSPDEARAIVKKMQNGGIEGKGTAKGEGDLVPEDQHLDPNTILYGNITVGQFRQAQIANDWFDWKNFDLKNTEDIKRFQREFNKRSTTGEKIKEDGKFGIQTQSAMLPFDSAQGVAGVDNTLKAPIYDRDGANQYADVGDTPAEEVEEKKAKVKNQDGTPGRGVYLRPDQELLPPTGMVPSTKIERRYGRMDAERFTPDQQLAELNRTVDAAMSQLEALPSGQREAAIVQLQANKQQQTDKIVSDVEKANKQIAQQEQAFNIRQADREVDASAVDTLSFEQRSLGAMANTEDDFRRYFNEGQRRNVENFKEIESINFMNALYENFDMTPDGIKNTVGSGIDLKDFLAAWKFRNAVGAGQSEATTTKKARGGRVRYKRK